MTATKAELNITFPQPCVIFLKNTKNTPRSLKWNLEFYDGQKVELQVPTICLGSMSIKEIADRNLLPIGQFYMRTFEPLTEKKVKTFRKAAEELLIEIKNAVDREIIPYHIGAQMQDTVRKTMETAIAKSKMEVDFKMTTNIIETLPWTNYREIFEKREEQARADGKAEGKAEGEAKGKAEGEAKGKAKGKAEGKIEGKAEVARNLKKLKTMTDKEIAELTGLSVSVVEKL
ncbi:MAG: hypothetical protein LBD23_20235 [Oscillospiraceae bacterium]|nr:hypothetical protein [Oscillospiraceae bacterium]